MNREHLTLLLLISATSTILFVNGLSSETVIGGYKVTGRRFRYQAYLDVKQNSSNRHGVHCGAAIIAENFILTAAHCFNFESNLSGYHWYEVRVGTYNIANNGSGILVEIDTIYIHKNFDPITFENDIALAKLKTNLGIDNNRHISQLNLPIYNASYNGTLAKLAGWGYHWIGLGKDPVTQKVKTIGGTDFVLRYAHVLILDNEECQKIVGPIPSTVICGKARNICGEPLCGFSLGDSGSIVIDGDVAIGILNKTPLDFRSFGSLSKYTNIALYVEFIRDIIDGKPPQDTRIYQAEQPNRATSSSNEVELNLQNLNI